MEKAKLTKAQAELLEKFKKEYVTEEEILENKFQNFVHDRDDHALKHIPVRTLAIALYVGYEIIEEDQVVTVTENMRDAIRKARNESGYSSEQVLETWLEGFDTALEALGIKL
jgi:hypothetical protein